MGPNLVFPRIQLFGSVDFSSRGKVYSRHVTGIVNCLAQVFFPVRMPFAPLSGSSSTVVDMRASSKRGFLDVKSDPGCVVLLD